MLISRTSNQALPVNDSTRGASRKIAIIGAGPSGLYAAEALRRQGHHDVTVFEKQARVGGMAFTRHFEAPDGRRIPYDMGSVQPFGSRNLFNLIKELDCHLGRDVGDGLAAETPYRFRIYDPERHAYVADYFQHPHTGQPLSKMPHQVGDFFKMLPWLIKFRHFTKPGYNHPLPPHLAAMTEHDWIEARNFKLVDVMLRAIFSFSTHGGLYNDPADPRSLVQSMKIFMYTLRPPLRYHNGHWLPIREGYQEILNRLAKRLNVMTSAEITSIQRRDGYVTMMVNGQKHTFDDLIVACPPAKLSEVMDFDDEEASIFSRVKNRPTWRVCFLARGIPEPRAVYAFTDQVTNPQAPPSLGDFHCDGRVEGEGLNALRIYDGLIGHNRMDGIDAAIERATDRLANVLGAKDVRWVDKIFWPQFNSHFGLEDVASGIYARCDRLQGNRSTYYTGEYLSGNSHSMTLEYSWNLVAKYFSAQTKGLGSQSPLAARA